jgi:NADH-quinone oxidoreductase subunit M
MVSLTSLIIIPLAWALVAWVLPQAAARWATFLCSGLEAVLALLLWHRFDAGNGALQLVERANWVPAIGAEYFLGVDGLSLLLVLLTTLIIPFALLAEPRGRSFSALMLFLQAMLYGTFTAQNFVLWFLFYELSLVPAFLLIKIWGGANRDVAATKFFVYTILGSVGMLLGFLAIYFAAGTFDFEKLTVLGQKGGLATLLVNHFGNAAVWLVFVGIFIGLAVKVPLVPFHSWMPEAYASAPVGGSMVLTGALSKMGVYGFVRLLLPLLPQQAGQLEPWLLALAVATIVLGAFAAWVQTDLKKMLAYLSLSHLGYAMLGLFAIVGADASALSNAIPALGGVFMQIFNHGVTAAALFYYIGLLEQRRQGRRLADFGGLMQRAPILCCWLSVTMFSSLGLPGLNSFVGEFLIFKGAFALSAIASSIAVAGLLITAVVFLRIMQGLFSGPLSLDCAEFPELTVKERCVAIPVTLLMLWIGIAPQFLLNVFNSTVVQMTRLLG